MTADRTALRRKTRHISVVLERFLGIPRRNRDGSDPLDMLVATILSQNTNDKNSHNAYTLLRQRYPLWETVARAPLRNIIRAIRSGGMANQKARTIKNVLKTVGSRYGTYDLASLKGKTNGEIIAELTSLKGVGVKTAACVLLFSMNRDVFPVDTHVHRICVRLGLAPDCKTPEQTFRAMQGFVPPGKSHALHTNMIRFGRKICRANRPSCDLCPLYDRCLYPLKARIDRRRSKSIANHDFMLLDNVRPRQPHPRPIA